MRFTGLLIVSIVVNATPLLAATQEWPKWRGPNGDSIATSPIADHWPADGPPKVWDQKVGLGYSSPIALDGKIYLFSQQGNLDNLSCFDAQSGKVLWSQSYKVRILADLGQAKNPDTNLPLPLATPTIDHGVIYTYGGAGDLSARKLEDGAELWHLNVLTATHEKILSWNEASSPLVTEQFVYVQGGKNGPTAVAVDRKTGKIAWQSQATTVGGYAAPIIADVDNVQQLIIFAGDHLYAMNPQTGATIWGYPWKSSYDVNASTPIYRDHDLFISSGYDHGAMMLKLTPAGFTPLWDHVDRDLTLKFQPGILDRDYLYANSRGVLKCVHWPDGKLAWEKRLRLDEGGSIVRDGDLLITLSERGKLSLVTATPQASTVLSQVQLFDFGTAWSTPLIYRGKLYAMGKDHLVCLNISEHAVRGPAMGSTDLARAR